MAEPFDRTRPELWATRCLWPDTRDAFVAWCTRQPQGWEPEPHPMLTAGWAAYAQFHRAQQETTHA